MTKRATQVEYYAFVHQTFWKYFYACSLVWQFEQEQTISLNELIEEVFGQHWQDEKWHQVLQFIARAIEPQFVDVQNWAKNTLQQFHAQLKTPDSI